jgi:uncharacterized protein (DUF983 family)
MTVIDLSAQPTRATAMMRGFMCRCPRCGQGALFKSVLKLADTCSCCGEVLGDIRADDIPAYFTILVVGHIVVPLMLWSERFQMSSLVELSIGIPLMLALTAVLLPRIKGATAALLWSLDMRSGAPS